MTHRAGASRFTSPALSWAGCFPDVSRAARGADLDRRSPGVGGVPRVHIDIEVHVHGTAVAMCAPAVPYVAGCFAVAPRSPETGASRTWRLGLWPEPSGVPRPCSVMPDGRSVGKRVLRRLEAALKPPSRVGIDGSGATPRDGGRGAQTHLPPNPYQALGLGGRSRPGQCCPCGADRPGREGARRGRVVAYSVAPARIAGGPKCASAPRVVCALQCGHETRAGRHR